MADADTSRSQLLYRKEVAFNEATPADPAMTELRKTRENFKLGNVTVSSNDVRSDRMISDLLLVGKDVTGGFSFEFADAEYDAFLATLLSGAWAGGVLKNGVVAPESYQFERGLLDVSQFFLFKGCTPNQLNLTIPSRQIVTGDFSFMGTLAAINPASVLGAGVKSGPSVVKKITSGPGINNIQINGAPIGVGVRQIQLTINGNIRNREVVDDYVTRQQGRGNIDITGSVQMYFANAAIYNYFISNAAFSLAFNTADGTGTGAKQYAWFLPVCKPPDDTVEVTGQNADFIETVSFRALYDPVIGAEIRITKTTLP